MPHDHDDLERRVAAAGLPGLAATSALLRRLNGAGIDTGGVDAKHKPKGTKRVRSRLFLHTGSQR